MRVPVCLTSLLLASCSSVLGIEDPRIGSDAGVDAEPMVEHLRFTLGDFKLAQGQRVRLGVEHVRTDGSVEDVTSTAIVAADNSAIVTVAAGTVESGSQPGDVNISATWGTLPKIMVRASVTTVTCHPVINELRTAGKAANDEWVEIYNPCVTAISVDGWALKYRAAATKGPDDDTLMATLAGSMAPGSFRLYAGLGYSGASTATWSGASGLMKVDFGSVGLRTGPMSTDMLVDSVAYGVPNSPPPDQHPFIETSSTPLLSSSVSAARTPDGIDFSAGSVDGDNSANFTLTMMPTPGTTNRP